MAEIEDVVKETLESAAEGGLTAAIALLVAVTATTMAICHIKDSNIVLAMNRVQTKTVDSWSYYQAKSNKQHLAENMLAQIRLQMEINPAAPKLAQSLGLAPIFETARMYTGPDPVVDLSGLYAVTSLELG